MTQKFYTPTFQKLPDDKKSTILNIAAENFSKQGYNSASINVIAQRANISIGAMYSYFSSKKNLFLTVVNRGAQLLAQILIDVLPEEGTIFEVIERLLKLTIDYSKSNPELVQLYHSLSTEELSNLAELLNDTLENAFMDFYIALLNRGIKRGELRRDLDVAVCAMYLDNLVVMLELSFGNTYHQCRLARYLGKDIDAVDQTRVCQILMDFIKRSLA